MKILVTGAAGFIGYHLAKRLAVENNDVICIDNINEYYDINLKLGRLKELGFDYSPYNLSSVSGIVKSVVYHNLWFAKLDLINRNDILSLFENHNFDVVAHLAAQAGVRYSLVNPNAYIESNIQGFLNLLEAIKQYPVRHLIYASSSSIYGIDSDLPFRENNAADHPVSLYAVSKRTNELMAHVYSHLYNIRTTGLRFFTVYGPWGRPDMAPFIFTKSIIEDKPINVFNNGEMKRDFTYIDDIIEGIIQVMRCPPPPPSPNAAANTVYNIGNGKPVELMDFIHSLENILGKKAVIHYAPMQQGDVPATWADCSALERDTGYCPGTPLDTGIKNFVAWYKRFWGKEQL
jgi:UDP-glucuronate 4-epimerase